MEEFIRIIDAHSHLWLKQDTVVDGERICALPDGRALFFGEERQMLPPFMVDGCNSAEVFLSNMNYAQVSAAVVLQELIDGNQNDYLLEVMRRYPSRLLCCAMPDFSRALKGQADEACGKGFRAIALPAHRIKDDLNSDAYMSFFKEMDRNGMILSICLADDAGQISRFEEVVEEIPSLKVAVGHFGMATGSCWKRQVLLARHPNVYLESGGITWLYNSEFYPYPSAVKAVLQAAECVGMVKLMWGSDYPRTITAITYRMSYDFLLKSKELTFRDKKLFLSDNAARFYGFEDLLELPYIKNMSE